MDHQGASVLAPHQGRDVVQPRIVRPQVTPTGQHELRSVPLESVQQSGHVVGEVRVVQLDRPEGVVDDLGYAAAGKLVQPEPVGMLADGRQREPAWSASDLVAPWPEANAQSTSRAGPWPGSAAMTCCGSRPVSGVWG